MTKAYLTNILLIVSLFASPSYPGTQYSEKWYQEKWCAENGGQIEMILSDRSRCDCVTNEYAVEIEFACKWKEAIGQALHYANMTGKKAGIF